MHSPLMIECTQKTVYNSLSLIRTPMVGSVFCRFQGKRAASTYKAPALFSPPNALYVYFIYFICMRRVQTMHTPNHTLLYMEPSD